MPSVRPVKLAVVVVPGTLTWDPPGVMVTVYDVATSPPSSEGIQRTEAERAPGEPLTATGASGAVSGQGVSVVPSAKAANAVASPAKRFMSTLPTIPGNRALAVCCHSVHDGQPPTTGGAYGR